MDKKMIGLTGSISDVIGLMDCTASGNRRKPVFKHLKKIKYAVCVTVY